MSLAPNLHILLRNVIREQTPYEVKAPMKIPKMCHADPALDAGEESAGCFAELNMTQEYFV